MLIRKTRCAEKAFELVTIVLGGPKAIEIALLALNFLDKLNLALPERIYSQALAQSPDLIHLHLQNSFLYICE